MSFEKRKGLVIGVRVVNDSDVILTLISEKDKKRKFIIKGLKKSKKRPIAASEPASLVEIDYYDRENKEAFHVREINIVERFERIKSSYGGFLLVSYLSELIDRLLPDGEDCNKIYLLFLSFLEAMEKGQFTSVVIPYIKLKILSLNGIIPHDLHCSICGKSVETMESGMISHVEMDIACSDCRPNERNDIQIIKLLEKLLTMKYSELKKNNFALADVISTDTFINHYLGIYLGRDLKSAAILYRYLGKKYELSY